MEKSFLNNAKKEVLFASAMAVLSGLFFGLIILLITNTAQAPEGFWLILQGGFGDGAAGLSQTLYLATPLIMTGLSVGFAWKTGLFNIGASGQFTVGAFAAIYIGVKWTFLPPGIHWIVAILGAALAGAIWGLIPGLLKAVSQVNEVIASIMMNYVGLYLTNLLITKTVYDQVKNQSMAVAKGAQIPKLGLDLLFPNGNFNIGILIALLFVIFVYILMEKTIFGFELKACGQNREASRYAGIEAGKSIVSSMAIAGALAGVGGALLYLADFGKYMQVVDVIAPQGFGGISVALLGLSNPFGILAAALLIGHITIGGYQLQLLSFTPELIDIIIAVIIYCSAFSVLFRKYSAKIFAGKIFAGKNSAGKNSVGENSAGNGNKKSGASGRKSG